MISIFSYSKRVLRGEVMATSSKTVAPTSAVVPKKPWAEPECEPIDIPLITNDTGNPGTNDSSVPETWS